MSPLLESGENIMILRQIALVSEATGISLADLAPVSAALQKQVTRDLGPLWGVQATVDCFERLESVPPGYWSITVRADLPPSIGSGIHEDKVGQPFALVRAAQGWQLSASHETLEMLVDPFGRRTVAGQSPMPGQGRVDFLLEVCDPCESASFGYTVNGVPVSDFCTPNYFEPVTNPAVRYSFTGALTQPRQVLKGGYLSWHDPISNHWFRESFFGQKPRFIDLGQLEAAPGMNFRSLIYEKTPESFDARQPSHRTSRRLRVESEFVSVSTQSKAAALREQISAIIARKATKR
jgi:hypothetical protein